MHTAGERVILELTNREDNGSLKLFYGPLLTTKRESNNHLADKMKTASSVEEQGLDGIT